MADEIETNSTETETGNSEETTKTEATTQSSEESSSATTEEKLDLAKSGDETKVEAKTEETKAEVDARYGAPEGDAAYDIKLEGDVKIDDDALAMVTPELKALNLSNEAATKLVGTFAEKVLPHYEQQFTANLEQQITLQRTEWEGAARDLIAGKDQAGEPLVAKNPAGEVLGFDGNDMAGVQKIAAKALDRIAPEGFRQFLEETGLGVHPQMIALAYQAGKLLGEDDTFETTGKTATAPSRVEKYYG